MRTLALGLLAAFAFATSVAAQTVPQPSKPATPTDKLWKIEVAGLGG
ncbi:MAG: hypothetical protein IPK26_12840 [Planctomycetes bacterium]|nr:hypothetical protein [Planctomycetota bacterium]